MPGKYCDEAIPASEPLPEEMTENTELQHLLRAAMVSLPPQFRSIVDLHCFRQLTFSEIGQTLNMPVTTVKTYFYRSLLRVPKALCNGHRSRRVFAASALIWSFIQRILW